MLSRGFLGEGELLPGKLQGQSPDGASAIVKLSVGLGLLHPVLLDQIVQGRAADFQELGGLGDVAVGGGQGLPDGVYLRRLPGLPDGQNLQHSTILNLLNPLLPHSLLAPNELLFKGPPKPSAFNVFTLTYSRGHSEKRRRSLRSSPPLPFSILTIPFQQTTFRVWHKKCLSCRSNPF